MDRRWLLVGGSSTIALIVFAACSSPESNSVSDQNERGELGVTSSALQPSDPVSMAVDDTGCSTALVMGLSSQLEAEIKCMKPEISYKRIDNVSGITLGPAVHPTLQTPVANALIAAQAARGVQLTVNSGFRTLVGQYLLYKWKQAGRCGITAAATPGTSNHESGLAVDINDNASWKTEMENQHFHWLGSGDPPHFDYQGTGVTNLTGMSVRAFQQLWNRNNPSEQITEDGSWGPTTEGKLAKSPVGGFATPANCANADAGIVVDSGTDPDPATDQPVDPTPVKPKPKTSTPAAAPASSGDSGGCSLGTVSHRGAGTMGGGLAGGGVGLLALLALRRRRQR